MPKTREMTKRATAKLGEGIYTAADAARILDIPYPKANYWFKFYARQKLSESVDYIYHFEIKNIIAVNFLTLLEMNIFFKLKEKNFVTKDIIEIHRRMAEAFNTYYPFAHKTLYVEQFDAKVKRKKHQVFFGDSGLFVHLDRDVQTTFPEIVMPLCEKITFDNKQLAKRYYPLGKDRTVVVDPQHQFGQPVIEGTNILTETLVDYYRGGESVDFIASLYNIRPQNVKDAIEFAKAA